MSYKCALIIMIAYIYHWKCRTSKVRRTIHRIHLIEFFDVLYVEIIRLQVNTTSKKNLSRKSNDITSKSSQSMHRKLKGVRMSINFHWTYLSSQHENKFEIKIAPYLSQVLSFDLHEGRKWVLSRKVLRHHQDQVPWWRDKMKISRNWNEERRKTSDHHKWFQRNDAKTTVSTFAGQRNQWNRSISDPTNQNALRNPRKRKYK